METMPTESYIYKSLIDPDGCVGVSFRSMSTGRRGRLYPRRLDSPGFAWGAKSPGSRELAAAILQQETGQRQNDSSSAVNLIDTYLAHLAPGENFVLHSNHIKRVLLNTCWPIKNYSDRVHHIRQQAARCSACGLHRLPSVLRATAMRSLDRRGDTWVWMVALAIAAPGEQVSRQAGRQLAFRRMSRFFRKTAGMTAAETVECGTPVRYVHENDIYHETEFKGVRAFASAAEADTWMNELSKISHLSHSAANRALERAFRGHPTP
jgi:hypothetical protein